MKKLLVTILTTFLILTSTVTTIFAVDPGEVGYVFYTDGDGKNSSEDPTGKVLKVTITDAIGYVKVGAIDASSTSGRIAIPVNIASVDNLRNYVSRTIDEQGFKDCTGLTEIVLHQNINTIGSEAFKGCTNLVKVTIESGYVSSVGNDIFKDCTNLTSIYVPLGRLSDYSTSTYWSDYSALFKELIVNTWSELQTAINDTIDNRISPTTIALGSDIVADTMDNAIVIPANKNVSINLNGHMINRNLSSAVADGNVIVINAGGELYINGKREAGEKITGGYNSSNTGGAIYNNGGTLSVSSCVIADNNAINGGAIYNANNGKVNLSSATLTNNTATNGGAIYNDSGEINNTYAIYENNTATNGGAIYTKSFIGFTQSIINGCSANKGGGTYVANGGRFETYGGLGGVTGCNANEIGGAIYIEQGGVSTFASGVKIINNTSVGNGGGIYSDGVIGLETSDVSTNEANTGIGNGIYVSNTGGIFVGSNASVTNNTHNSIKNNLYIANTATLTIGSGPDVPAPSYSMNIGISMQTPGVFTTNVATNHKNKFTSDDETYSVFYNADDKLKLAIPRTVTFESNGGSLVDQQVIADGDKAIKPTNPTKSGYTFVGWYDELLQTPYSFDAAVNANITLYAKWNEIKPTYIIPNTGVN